MQIWFIFMFIIIIRLPFDPTIFFYIIILSSVCTWQVGLAVSRIFCCDYCASTPIQTVLTGDERSSIYHVYRTFTLYLSILHSLVCLFQVKMVRANAVSPVTMTWFREHPPLQTSHLSLKARRRSTLAVPMATTWVAHPTDSSPRQVLRRGRRPYGSTKRLECGD